MKVQHYDAEGNWVEEEATIYIDGEPYESFAEYLVTHPEVWTG